MKISALRRPTFFQTLSWILATWFGSGLSPKAPGTVGSLFALPIIAVGYIWGLKTYIGFLVVLFVIGWLATRVVLKSQKELDPGFVVIDEVIGQGLTFALVIGLGFSWVWLISGFLLFRLFDIIKIWPASYFDGSVHNAFGVMMDDVVAGLYAALILYGITFI